MTTAEMTQSQFLSHLPSLDTAGDGEAASDIVVESSFFRVKEVLDRIVGLLLLLPALPLIGLLIALVRLTSRGPGVFAQKRVGKKGRIFTMYKLRSMRIDAEARTGPVWANVAGDPRVTPLGYWLRRLHLDELPQLFNVVRGEMSLVGPRPERPEFVAVLADQVPGYLNRIAVHPGITGLAQINLPPDTDLDSVSRKLVLDCDYIRTATAWLDFRIVFCTALRMAWIRGPVVTRILGLERLAVISAGHQAAPAAEPASPISAASLSAQTADRLQAVDLQPQIAD